MSEGYKVTAKAECKNCEQEYKITIGGPDTCLNMDICQKCSPTVTWGRDIPKDIYEKHLT